MNPGYDKVLKRLHFYCDMKLVTFGIDRNKNLIIQFLVFIQPYTQQPLVLYQIETVPVPIIDQNMQADSYMHIQVDRPHILDLTLKYTSQLDSWNSEHAKEQAMNFIVKTSLR